MVSGFVKCVKYEAAEYFKTHYFFQITLKTNPLEQSRQFFTKRIAFSYHECFENLRSVSLIKNHILTQQ